MNIFRSLHLILILRLILLTNDKTILFVYSIQYYIKKDVLHFNLRQYIIIELYRAFSCIF